MSNITDEQGIEWLNSKTVLQLAELVKTLEGKWGVSAAATMAAAAPGAAAAGAAPAEEKTEFTVVLVEAGANKIGAIKEDKEPVSYENFVDGSVYKDANAMVK